MDTPDLTLNEMRGLIYIHDINQELAQPEPATITQLSEMAEWRSKYFTDAWTSLKPRGLVDREKDGVNTRLSTTDHGDKVVSLLKQLNKELDEAENR